MVHINKATVILTEQELNQIVKAVSLKKELAPISNDPYPEGDSDRAFLEKMEWDKGVIVIEGGSGLSFRILIKSDRESEYFNCKINTNKEREKHINSTTK